MRILWLSQFFPGEPPDHHARTEEALLRPIAEQHDVHVVSTTLPPGEVTCSIGRAQITCEGVNWWPRYPRTFISRAASTLLPGPPMDIRATRSRARLLANVVSHSVERRRPDLIVSTAMELAPVTAVSDVPTALLVVRSMSGHYRARAAAAGLGPARRLRRLMDARRAAAWERRWTDHVATVVSADDEDGLRRWLERIEPDHGRAAARPQTSAPAAQEASTGRQTATIVVCTRERGPLLAQTLPTVAAAAERVPGTDVLVVQQGEPVAPRVLEALGADTVVNDDGTGAAHARNLGARRAEGSVLLFTDDDCAVPPDWVRDHLAALQRPDVLASFGVVEGLSGLAPGEPDLVAWPARHHAGSPPWAIGHSSNMAVLCEEFLRVGGFDERFGPGARGGMVCEDADLIVRLLRSGGTLVSGVGAPVRHLEWRSDEQDSRNLRAYERGAGAWIGKLLREDRGAATPYLRERIELMRNRLTDAREGRTARVSVLMSVGSLVRGFAFGLRLAPWPPEKPGADGR